MNENILYVYMGSVSLCVYMCVCVCVYGSCAKWIQYDLWLQSTCVYYTLDAFGCGGNGTCI